MFKKTIEFLSPQTKLEDILKEKNSKTTLIDDLSEDDAVILMLQGKYDDSIKNF
jgi:hypothetical protein